MSPQDKEQIDQILAIFGGAEILTTTYIQKTVAEWPENKREAYEERAAICQHDAHIPKHLAEALAFCLVEMGTQWQS